MEMGGMEKIKISIHALRKESDGHPEIDDSHDGISIHALRKESDHQSLKYPRAAIISIHALRKESDWGGARQGRSSWYFNPRSP